MTDDSGQDEAPEWARQVFRAVQDYVAGVRTAVGDVGPVALKAGDALGVHLADVAAVIERMGATGSAAEPGHITSSGGLRLPKLAFAPAGEVVVSLGPEAAAVVGPQDVGELSSRASRDGIAGFSTMQVFTLVLLWLMALGLPVVQQALPQGVQAALLGEYGTIAIAVAVTAEIRRRR